MAVGRLEIVSKQLQTFRRSFIPPHHERRCTESCHLPRCNPAYVYFLTLVHSTREKKISVARKIPLEDLEVLTQVRIGYVLSQVIALRVHCYVSVAMHFHVSFSNELVNELVFSGQEKERPNGAQIQLALSLSARGLTHLRLAVEPASFMVRAFVPASLIQLPISILTVW